MPVAASAAVCPTSFTADQSLVNLHASEQLHTILCEILQPSDETRYLWVSLSEGWYRNAERQLARVLWCSWKR